MKEIKKKCRFGRGDVEDLGVQGEEIIIQIYSIKIIYFSMKMYLMEKKINAVRKNLC